MRVQADEEEQLVPVLKLQDAVRVQKNNFLGARQTSPISYTRCKESQIAELLSSPCPTHPPVYEGLRQQTQTPEKFSQNIQKNLELSSRDFDACNGKTELVTQQLRQQCLTRHGRTIDFSRLHYREEKRQQGISLSPVHHISPSPNTDRSLKNQEPQPYNLQQKHHHHHHHHQQQQQQILSQRLILKASQQAFVLQKESPRFSTMNQRAHSCLPQSNLQTPQRLRPTDGLKNSQIYSPRVKQSPLIRQSAAFSTQSTQSAASKIHIINQSPMQGHSLIPETHRKQLNQQQQQQYKQLPYDLFEQSFLSPDARSRINSNNNSNSKCQTIQFYPQGQITQSAGSQQKSQNNSHEVSAQFGAQRSSGQDQSQSYTATSFVTLGYRNNGSLALDLSQQSKTLESCIAQTNDSNLSNTLSEVTQKTRPEAKNMYQQDKDVFFKKQKEFDVKVQTWLATTDQAVIKQKQKENVQIHAQICNQQTECNSHANRSTQAFALPNVSIDLSQRSWLNLSVSAQEQPTNRHSTLENEMLKNSQFQNKSPIEFLYHLQEVLNDILQAGHKSGEEAQQELALRLINNIRNNNRSVASVMNQSIISNSCTHSGRQTQPQTEETHFQKSLNKQEVTRDSDNKELSMNRCGILHQQENVVPQ